MTSLITGPTLGRRRDSETTRSCILDSAESVFVERGFAATAMSEIATRAGVTKSLIHHHFGSKESLWEEVKRRRLDDYSKLQLRAMSEGDPSADGFADAIRSHFHFLRDNPGWVRLNAWMNLEDERLSAPTQPELMEAALRTIRASQAAGVLRDDVLAENAIAAFMALCTQWFLNKHAYEQEGNDESQAADERYLDDLIKIFFEGVTPRP